MTITYLKCFNVVCFDNSALKRRTAAHSSRFPNDLDDFVG
jgi:hypothetical protein